ncbi:MAG: LamG-like jellyroll fold domain-containing protein, partial [Verrucomicrobiota bacterium]
FDNPGLALGENLALDSDGDGISDVDETAGGTDPDNADTDSDGLLDGEEITAGTDPTNPDTDGDSLLDGREVALGYDPNSDASPGAAIIGLSLVAYWPLDELNGDTTPDSGGLYPLTAVNMTADNVVAGRIGNAMSFDGSSTMLEYLAGPNEDLPINLQPEKTISLWVKTKGTGQNDLRFFAEASTTDGTPLFNMGTQNNGEADTVDMYIRPPGRHEFSEATPLDDSWRHLAWVEGNGTGTLYIDGVADTRATWSVGSFAPDTLNTTSIGGIRRANPSHWFEGLVDDVSVWNRLLTATEIADLAGGKTPLELIGTNPPEDGDAPTITAISRNSTGGISLTFSGTEDRIYDIE